MKKDVILALLIAVLLVTACGTAPDKVIYGTVLKSGLPDGQVVAVPLMQTIQYMFQVFRGDPNTFIMQSPGGQFLFACARGSDWVFLGVGTDGKPIVDILKNFCGANCSNAFTFTDLVKTLENGGWKYVLPSAVPGTISAAFGSATTFAIRYGSLLASPIPLFIIMPGGDFVNPFPTARN